MMNVAHNSRPCALVNGEMYALVVAVEVIEMIVVGQ